MCPCEHGLANSPSHDNIFAVVLSRLNKDIGKEETLQIMNKGEIFGDTEVLEESRRPATVTTCLETMFWSVDAEVLTILYLVQSIMTK